VLKYSYCEIIVYTSAELCLPSRKFPISAGYISIIQPKVETFSRRTRFSNWELRISARQVVLNVLARR
jgi:hypothetical protein